MRTNIARPRSGALLLSALIAASAAPGQSPEQWRDVLDRLERLERENRALAAEVKELRARVGEPASSPPPPAAALEERVEIAERRIEEQAQIKVEASQKFPVRLTGMLLFNSFLNSKGAAGADNPTSAAAVPGPASGGATFRQTVLGLAFEGPRSVLGGKVSGNLYMDFFGGQNQAQNHFLRVRTAVVEIDWGSRSVIVGQEKPLISPREPNSLAQVGVSPLTGAGNLWLWLPQVRFEQRFGTENAGVRAQAALMQTNEVSLNVPAAFAASLERTRPGYQGRLEFFGRFSEGRRIELAPSFHASTTHVAGVGVPSRVAHFDWLVAPWSKLEFTGAAFTGKNVAIMGSNRQGVTVLGFRNAIPVHSRGGWAQATFLAAPRLTFNVYGGQHDDRNADLRFGGIGKNHSWAANAMYRIAPNLIVGLEASQVRTFHLQGIGWRKNNHYDLAVAYLF